MSLAELVHCQLEDVHTLSILATALHVRYRCVYAGPCVQLLDAFTGLLTGLFTESLQTQCRGLSAPMHDDASVEDSKLSCGVGGLQGVPQLRSP